MSKRPLLVRDLLLRSWEREKSRSFMDLDPVNMMRMLLRISEQIKALSGLALLREKISLKMRSGKDNSSQLQAPISKIVPHSKVRT